MLAVALQVETETSHDVVNAPAAVLTTTTVTGRGIVIRGNLIRAASTFRSKRKFSGFLLSKFAADRRPSLLPSLISAKHFSLAFLTSTVGRI